MGNTCIDSTPVTPTSQVLTARILRATDEVYQRGGSEFANRAFIMVQRLTELELGTRLELLAGILEAWVGDPHGGGVAVQVTGWMYGGNRNQRVLNRLVLHWRTRGRARQKLGFTPVRRLVARARRVLRQLGAMFRRCRAPRTPRRSNVAVQHSSGGGGGPGEDPDSPDAPAPHHIVAPVAPPTSSPTTEDTPLRHLARGLLVRVLKGGAGW